MRLRRVTPLLMSLPVLAACGETAPSPARSHAWLELAGDPEVSPAELSSLLHGALAPDQQAGLDRLAEEASKVLGQRLTGADMVRFEGLQPGQRVRRIEVTPDGKLRVALDRVVPGAGGGAGSGAILPEPLTFEQAGEAGGIVVPGLLPASPGGT